MDALQLQRIPVWLDCDPGHDDAMAIILAGHSPHLVLLGVSTVAGNQALHKVTRNALDVLHAAGLSHIDVVPGQCKPIIRPSPILCPEIHGESGLDVPVALDRPGQLLPASTRTPLAGKAVNVMFDRIQSCFKAHGCLIRVRLVCVGALTNAALLLALYPEVVPMMEIVIMGGAQGVGNTGAVMEFNIQTDPEAAKMVIESGIALTMVPLEVTHTVLVTPDVLAAVAPASLPTPFRMLVKQLLLFFAATYRAVFSFEHPPLHDPCAVAYCIAPELFQAQDMRVDIETSSCLSSGQTVCDVWGQSGKHPNCRVALRVDVPGFWRLMLAALDAADAASPMNTTTAAGVPLPEGSF